MGDALYGLGEKERGIAMMREALQIYVDIESLYAEQARGQLEAWGVP
jgi:hypothetical protein